MNKFIYIVLLLSGSQLLGMDRPGELAAPAPAEVSASLAATAPTAEEIKQFIEAVLSGQTATVSDFLKRFPMQVQEGKLGGIVLCQAVTGFYWGKQRTCLDVFKMLVTAGAKLASDNGKALVWYLDQGFEHATTAEDAPKDPDFVAQMREITNVLKDCVKEAEKATSIAKPVILKAAPKKAAAVSAERVEQITKFVQAAYEGNIDEIKASVEKDRTLIDSADKTNEYKNALHAAIDGYFLTATEGDHYAVFDYLLQQGADRHIRCGLKSPGQRIKELGQQAKEKTPSLSEYHENNIKTWLDRLTQNDTKALAKEPTASQRKSFIESAFDGDMIAVKLFCADFPNEIKAPNSVIHDALFAAIDGYYSGMPGRVDGCPEVFKFLVDVGANTKATYKGKTLEGKTLEEFIAHVIALTTKGRDEAYCTRVKDRAQENWLDLIKKAEDEKPAKEASKMTPEEKAKQEAAARAKQRRERLIAAGALVNVPSEAALKPAKSDTVASTEQQLKKAQEEAAELRAKAVAADAEVERLFQSSNAANAWVDEVLEMLSAAREQADSLKPQAAYARELAERAKAQASLAEEKVKKLLAAKSK